MITELNKDLIRKNRLSL